MESTMGNSKTVSKTVLFILLVALSFEQGCSAATAKLFPNRAQAWTKIPTVVVSGGKDGDPRNQLVIDAVDFWNQQLSDIGSAFRLGPVTFTNEIIPDEELGWRIAKEKASKKIDAIVALAMACVAAMAHRGEMGNRTARAATWWPGLTHLLQCKTRPHQSHTLLFGDISIIPCRYQMWPEM